MKEKLFSKREAIRYGWDTMKNNFVFFVGVIAVVLALYAVPGFLIEATREKAPLISIIVQIIRGLIQMIISMGLLKIALSMNRGEKASFAHLFNTYPLFLNFFIASIIYGLIVFGGTLLLIVPGIVWGIQFQYFRYFIVDRGQGPVEALKSSSRITVGAKWQLFLLSLLLGLINLAGLLALFVGLFVSIPVTIIADAYVYRQLAQRLEASSNVSQSRPAANNASM